MKAIRTRPGIVLHIRSRVLCCVLCGCVAFAFGLGLGLDVEGLLLSLFLCSCRPVILSFPPLHALELLLPVHCVTSSSFCRLLALTLSLFPCHTCSFFLLLPLLAASLLSQLGRSVIANEGNDVVELVLISC